MKWRHAQIVLPATLLAGVLVACGPPPYHQPEERYVFVAFNTSLPYWRKPRPA